MRATTSAVSLRRQSLYTSILIRRFPMRPPSGAATIYRQSARNSAMRAGGLSSDLVRSAGKLALFDRARAGGAMLRSLPGCLSGRVLIIGLAYRPTSAYPSRAAQGQTSECGRLGQQETSERQIRF